MFKHEWSFFYKSKLEKLNELTEEEFAGLSFEPAEE